MRVLTVKNIVLREARPHFGIRSNLGLTRGILVILDEKGTLSTPMSERVMPRFSRYSHGPTKRKKYF